MSPPVKQVTQLLLEMRGGRPDAKAQLLELVYPQLRELAKAYMRHQRPGHTLQPTALLHEAYIRLIDQDQLSWDNRIHFFATAAQAMRQILVDHHRKRATQKRGAAAVQLHLDEAALVPDQKTREIIEVDDALKDLAKIDANLVGLVELKYFAGLTGKEIAEVLGCSPETVKRMWSTAREWLRQHMSTELPT